MKNFLIAFSIFLVWAFFALWVYSWIMTPSAIASSGDTNNITSETELLHNTETDKKPIIENEIANTTNVQISEDTIASVNHIETNATGLRAVDDNNDIIFSFDEGISIIMNKKNVFIADSIADFKLKIKNYLEKHPNKEVHINSRYSANEDIENPNLGIQRGQKLKKILVTVGVPAEKIVVKSIIKSLEFDKNNTFKNAIAITFTTLDEERMANEIKKIKENAIVTVPESIIIYPNYSENGVLIDEKLESLAGEIRQRVLENPNLKISVVGHTDNDDNATENYRMGLIYAREVRWYLAGSTGVKIGNITAISKGELQPIRSNNTSNGRRLNKRIEIKFQ
ncbi:hypothetical protein ULMS_18360 [Patiriisocius marinistellae]|uniref:OmpA-like domain-containing protein n=1 Tax=Patiriisocius marinistellae TaxID=2494560 RepID=A0A5J4FY89_9FLAO|nr:OmpA family protein [Patiriisocius marinistellae]GEQ86328.1 hypothetical protein ULMS_18360 [Patiriisocius marinistellae]